ncbi:MULTISPECIES: ATP-binding protein [Spirulina sp. CCY15215]|uniref:AAA family ATPase n=1 Tax=Spirulina sp. CCY15215 TaxID=2767591 RepID=UPI001950579E|nr:ATP-binding protein [Spirulina major]
MLIEFQVGNFLSFKKVVTFSMVASEIKSKDSDIDENNVFSVEEDLSLLKTAVIYGANASGKSNLAKAFSFMQNFVINSSKEMQITDEIDVEPFRLSTETEQKASFFQARFCLDKKVYRYGFKVSQKKIIKEWLYYTPNIQEYRLFERSRNGFKISPKFFKEGINLDDKTKPNSLFLSVSSQFNGKVSTQIIRWFANCRTIFGAGKYDNLYKQFTLRACEYPPRRKEIIELIKNLDLSIQDIEITKEEISPKNLFGSRENLVQSLFSKSLHNEFLIQTSHKKYDKNNEIVGLEKFDLEKNESEGTKKLFYFSALILNALRNRQILIVDELDARLHPIITHKLIQLFNSNDYNPKSAQLIFTTHDINLLNPDLFGSRLFRRDQIWFTEKNTIGATDLYSLVEYDISEDRDFESDYIRGRYGAIPLIGNLLKPLYN